MTLFNNHLLPFSVIILTGLFSIYFFIQKKHLFALIALLFSALVLRIVMISLDPFIWLWDEQFHALVARNMVERPFKPTLYENPLLLYNYKIWDTNHIWLHKQPLFLWQMAASMKIFDFTPFAFRLPSAIMFTLLVPVIYKMGKILINKDVGYIAALLFTFSFIFNEMITGSTAGDHNDVAFIFYVTLSIWAYLESTQSNKKYWIILIGLFSGMAVLVKWLPGLLVFSGWAIAIIFSKSSKTRMKKYLPPLFAFGITLIMFLPWYFYTHIVYPKESAWEIYMYHLHFKIPVEGHGGPWYYHFQNLPYLFGNVFTWLIVPALVIFYLKINTLQNRIAVMVYILFTFIFYSVSATKMPFFILIVGPLLLVAFAGLLFWLFELLQRKLKSLQVKFIQATVLIVFTYFFIQINSLDFTHTNERNIFRKDRMGKTEKYKKLIATIDNKKYTIVNCDKMDAPVIMFYSGMPAYGKMISDSEKNSILSKGYKIYVLNNGVMPDYLKNDKRVKIVEL